MAKSKLESYEYHADGRLAFSKAEVQLAEVRSTAELGRIQKLLEGKTFSPKFKETITEDYQDILSRMHLLNELKGLKRILQVLENHSSDPQVYRLWRKLRADPRNRKNGPILCPVWRHQHALEITTALIPRYFFREKASEIHFVTIVFDFATNLEELEDKIARARDQIKDLIRAFTLDRKGIVIAGAFEPDLHDHAELIRKNGDRRKLLDDLGLVAPETGGWVLTGHFLVRTSVKDELAVSLRKRYPSSGWNRVQLDPIHKNKTLAASVMNVIGYAAKYPQPLFGVPTRGPRLQHANEKVRRLKTAFSGPDWRPPENPDLFNIDAAILQWALFMDRLGKDGLFVTVESCHAQKWFSQSEWRYIRHLDLDLFEVHGESHQISELHRDFGLNYRQQVPDRLKGRLRRLRTRALRYDRDWLDQTDIGDPPFDTKAVSLEHWVLK